jgi:Tol biopolymer transport system component
MPEQQVTHGPGGRILTNINVWSPDSEWLVYDVRSDRDGSVFDGSVIERVRVKTGEVQRLFEAKNGAQVGVVTHHPSENKVVFIHGPENPTPDWSYGISHRQGVMVHTDTLAALPLDARDLTLPGTPGALRGGSHVHVWHPKGDWLSYTYNDALENSGVREVGVCFPKAVSVPKTHPRNHDGTHFSLLATKSTPNPKPNTDEIRRAFEEGWVGSSRTLAFLGELSDGKVEIFLAEGLETQRPTQRRLTHTKTGVALAPRHWVRSSPDGSQLAFLMADDAGIIQLWLVSPSTGALRQLTRNKFPIASAFTWHPDGSRIAAIADGSVVTIDAETGKTRRLTKRTSDAPLALACVFSHDGKQIAFLRHLSGSNQLYTVQG